MVVNILKFIIDLYLATTTASLIAFVLNFRRLDRYYRKQGLQAVFNEDSLVCLLMCFIPVVNLRYGSLYWIGSQFTDEEFEEYFKEEE